MKKMLFIVNPASGRSHIKNHLLDVVDIFVKAGYRVMVYPTQARYDALNAALGLEDDIDAVVCAGGDGTLNETIKGLMTLNKNIPIGYIPSGTMNDFASSLGIPKSMTEAAKIIAAGELIDIDIGSFNGEYFTYVAAFGAFTEVSYETPQQLKNVFGTAAYMLEGMKRLGTLKSYRVKISCGETEAEDDYIFGMVSNSHSVAGFKGLAGKDVEINDGFFETLFIKAPASLSQLQNILNSLIKRELDSEYFYTFKTTELNVHSDDDLPWTLDGENGGNCRNVAIKNHNSAIKIFTWKP